MYNWEMETEMKNTKSYPWLIFLIVLVTLSACSGTPQTSEASQATESAVAGVLTVPPWIYDSFYQSRNNEGIAVLGEFIKSNPDHPEAIALRAGFNIRLGKNDLAQEDIDRALELDPELALGYAVRAYLNSVIGGKDGEVQADLEKSLQLDSKIALVYALRGDAALKSGDFVSAQADYQRALELEPYYVSPQIYLGDAYLYQNKFNEAIQEYDAALSLVSEDSHIYYQRGLAKLNLQIYEGAIADLTSAIEKDNTQFPGSYVLRGIAYSAIGQYDKALADYEKAIEINPSDPTAFSNAAYLISQQENGDYQKALAYVSQALELEEPDRLITLDTQGFVYYRLGEFELAAGIFSAAINGGESYSYYGRGLTYEAMGENERAINDLQAFLAAYPNDPNSAKAKQHLEALGITQ